jgi:hypothetical protein
MPDSTEFIGFKRNQEIILQKVFVLLILTYTEKLSKTINWMSRMLGEMNPKQRGIFIAGGYSRQ